MKIGIMGAMHEEIKLITQKIHLHKTSTIGKRTYYEGELMGNDVVVVFSHWGKVAATLTVTTLINSFNVDKIIFTGVAGAISCSLNIGDIVVGKSLFQHDMNCSPILDRYEIPLMKSNKIDSSKFEIEQAYVAAKSLLEKDFGFYFPKNDVDKFNIKNPKVVIGDIASGDEFVSDEKTRNRIIKDLPSVVCVEMEGAAVAQVCNDFDIPFVIIRTISDSANNDSRVNFSLFIEKIASIYSLGIIENILKVKNSLPSLQEN